MTIDIESLRGLDAHRSADAELAARLAELDAEANGRPFSAAQKTEFETIVGQRDQLGAAIEELEIRDQIVQKAIASGSPSVEAAGTFPLPNINKKPEDVFDLAAYRKKVSSVDELPDAYRDGAMRVLDGAIFPTAGDQASAKGQVEKLVERHRHDEQGVVARRVIGTGSPVYGEAWANYLAGRPNAARMQAALQTYTDADGGFAIPFTIDPTFINTSDGSVNPLRRIARVETITTKNWQAITTAGVTAAYIGERTTTGASDGAPSDIDNPTVTPVRADVAVDLTAEFREDYGPAQIASEVGSLIQVAKDDLEANKFVLGTGVTQPYGVVKALVDDTTSIVLTITDNVFVLGDIDALIADVPPRFRSRMQLMANLAILQLIPPFGTAGQPGNSIYDAISGRLRGYPVNEATAMDAAATDAKHILLAGDFRAGFVIIDRLGLSTQVLDGRDTNGRPTGNSVVYARWRNSSNLLFPNAFRLLKVR